MIDLHAMLTKNTYMYMILVVSTYTFLITVDLFI